MGMKEMVANARHRAVDREIGLLISACERGEDVMEALIVSPLSDLDIRERDGWKRPDGLYYEDYIHTPGQNELTLLIENDNGSTSSMETTVNAQIELDKEHRDWQEPSGNLYEG